MGDLVLRDVEGWVLASEAGAEEPMVRDVDLAERLGFERPRKIRELIERHRAAGNLNDSDVRPTVGRTRIGIAERDVEEYWLTEAAAFFIAAKSDTPAAVAITKELIRVFMAARRGLLSPPPAAPALTADDVRAIVRAELGEAKPPARRGRPSTAVANAEQRWREYLAKPDERPLVLVMPGELHNVYAEVTEIAKRDEALMQGPGGQLHIRIEGRLHRVTSPMLRDRLSRLARFAAPSPSTGVMQPIEAPGHLLSMLLERADTWARPLQR